MEQNVLIQEVRELFNMACAENGAGHTEGANTRLRGIRDLLNNELNVEPTAPTPEPPSEPVT